MAKKGVSILFLLRTVAFPLNATHGWGASELAGEGEVGDSGRRWVLERVQGTDP